MLFGMQRVMLFQVILIKIIYGWENQKGHEGVPKCNLGTRYRKLEAGTEARPTGIMIFRADEKS